MTVASTSKEALVRIQKNWFTDVETKKAEIYLLGETISQRFTLDEDGAAPDMEVLSPTPPTPSATTDIATPAPIVDKDGLTSKKCKTTDLSLYEVVCVMMHETLVWPTWGTICSLVVSADTVKTKLKSLQRSVTRTTPLHRISTPFSYRQEAHDTPTGGLRLTVIPCTPGGPYDPYIITLQEEKWK